MSPAVRESRAALGAELRRLRILAGLGGRELAEAIHISQAKISRVETGQTMPSIPEARAWAAVTRASPADAERVERMTAAALNEVIPFSRWHAQGGAAGMQAEVRSIELTARSIASFQPCFVPGLLQTGEYARRVFATVGRTGDDLERAAAARLERQEILHDAGRRFEFILTDAALRWRSGPARPVLAAQLDRIATVATLENVAILVIPADADMHTAPTCAFALYEDRDDGEPPLAAVEAPHGRLESTTEEGGVQAYRDEFELLRRSAIGGQDAIAYVRGLADYLARVLGE